MRESANKQSEPARVNGTGSDTIHNEPMNDATLAVAVEPPAVNPPKPKDEYVLAFCPSCKAVLAAGERRFYTDAEIAAYKRNGLTVELYDPKTRTAQIGACDCTVTRVLSDGPDIDLFDATPITREWLAVMGFEPVPDDVWPDSRGNDNMALAALKVWEFNDSGEWLFSDCDFIAMRTRGEIRMMARLLKLELKGADEVFPGLA